MQAVNLRVKSMRWTAAAVGITYVNMLFVLISLVSGTALAVAASLPCSGWLFSAAFLAATRTPAVRGAALAKLCRTLLFFM